MFQCIELNETRSVWVDAAVPELGMGHFASSRIEIKLDPAGVSDWKEKGVAYKCVLLGGLWPDDDEIRLMILGYSPGSTESDNFLRALGRRSTLTKEEWKAEGKIVLMEGIQLMPVWAQARERMAFVSGAFTRGTAQDEAGNYQRTGTPDRTKPDALSFDHWRTLVDVELHKLGVPLTGDEELEDLKIVHGEGTKPVQFATERSTRTANVDAEQDTD